MPQPMVSVIIPNYNYAHYLRQAVESVLAQTYPRVEVVVVDDGSTDNSREVLAEYAANIRCVHQPNRGVAAARNQGARISSGDYLAFLDADDYWLPAKLERQIEMYRQDPELGLTHCGVEEFNERVGEFRQRTEGLAGWVARELLLFERPVILGGGSALMVPRRLFDEIGGFDERLSTSADWEFCYRMAMRWRVGFVSAVLVKYRLHGKNMHGDVSAMERDMLLGYEKAFAAPGNSLASIRRQCYGNLHLMLAGSFFASGRYMKFAEHLWRSLCYAPASSARVMGYPARLLRRTVQG